MADTKISALPASTTPLAGTEVLPIVQSGATRQVSVANLTTGRAISATEVTLSTGSLIVPNGQGVDFSATPNTGTSELFDDYEEGTWTPTDASGAGLTFSTAVGRYTKIGRVVSVQIQVIYPATLDVSAAKIGNFPFVAASAPTAQGSSFGYTNGSGATALLINASASIIEIYNAAGSAVTNAGMSSKFNYISFCYVTNT